MVKRPSPTAPVYVLRCTQTRLLVNASPDDIVPLPSWWCKRGGRHVAVAFSDRPSVPIRPRTYCRGLRPLTVRSIFFAAALQSFTCALSPSAGHHTA